jgi:hypothetical protein
MPLQFSLDHGDLANGQTVHKRANQTKGLNVNFAPWLASLPKNPNVSTPQALASVNPVCTTNFNGVQVASGTMQPGTSTPTAFYVQLTGGNSGVGEMGYCAFEVTTTHGDTDVFWFRIAID